MSEQEENEENSGIHFRIHNNSDSSSDQEERENTDINFFHDEEIFYLNESQINTFDNMFLIANSYNNRTIGLFATLLEEALVNRVMERSMEENNEESQPKKDENKKIDVIPLLYSNHKEKMSDVCSICTDTYKNCDVVSILDCKHGFHTNCIKEWGMYKPECPLCKCKIPLKNNINN
jgi:hypothetical protein